MASTTSGNRTLGEAAWIPDIQLIIRLMLRRHHNGPDGTDSKGYTPLVAGNTDCHLSVTGESTASMLGCVRNF